MKVDLGREEKNYPQACCAPDKAEEPKTPTICYPTFYVGNRYSSDNDDEDVDLGALKGGQVLNAQIRVKQIDRTEKKDGKVKLSYDFEVISIEAPGAEKPKNAKTSRQDDEDAVDKGIDEAIEGDENE